MIDDIDRSAEEITNDIVAAAKVIVKFPPKGEVVTINVLARLPASKRQEISERLPAKCAQKGLRLKSIPSVNEHTANCMAFSFFAA